MDDTHDGPHAREPQIEDLARLCRALNESGARYLLIGGFAVIARGGARTTKDIDFLIDPSPVNVARVKQALRILEDHAVDDVADDDVTRYAVVRVADEVVVDLMAVACGVDYATAVRDAETLTLAGVSTRPDEGKDFIRADAYANCEGHSGGKIIRWKQSRLYWSIGFGARLMF